MKNKIVIYTGIGENKRKEELFNFNEMKHVWVNSVSYIRICCDGKYYFYRTIETSISEIKVYEK